MKTLSIICFVTILLSGSLLAQCKFPTQSGNAGSFTDAALEKVETEGNRQSRVRAEANLFTGKPSSGRSELSRATTLLPLRLGQSSSGRRRFRKRPEVIRTALQLPIVRD